VHALADRINSSHLQQVLANTRSQQTGACAKKTEQPMRRLRNEKSCHNFTSKHAYQRATPRGTARSLCRPLSTQ
jgi:hypothetical protein